MVDPVKELLQINIYHDSPSRLHVRLGDQNRVELRPVTGRSHQLRVHLAALGAPIANDGMYPSLVHRAPGDYSAPLQLLAKRLSFIDPLSGVERSFSSKFLLQA